MESIMTMHLSGMQWLQAANRWLVAGNVAHWPVRGRYPIVGYEKLNLSAVFH
jgi:hypothetical protein